MFQNKMSQIRAKLVYLGTPSSSAIRNAAIRNEVPQHGRKNMIFDLDSVWAQSRHPGGLKIWCLVEFVRNFEANTNFDETIIEQIEKVLFFDVFGELDAHTRGGKYSPTYFAPFQTLKTLSKPLKIIFWVEIPENSKLRNWGYLGWISISYCQGGGIAEGQPFKSQNVIKRSSR